MQKLLFVHALSPLHAGTGQAVGAVDLPIARDKATGFPYLPGSGLKGSLRGRATELGRADTAQVFGPETQDASEHAGALVVGDAQLLLLPVRSVSGTFAYVTSPWLLLRFARDAREVGLTPPDVYPINKPQNCGVPSGTGLNTTVGTEEKIVFEDLDLTPHANVTTAATQWADFVASRLLPTAEQAAFKKRFCIVHDDVMAFFSRHATDVVTRVCIEHTTGTAKDGQLWTEESLPVETVLVSLLHARPIKGAKPAEVLKAVEELTQGQGQGALQLGGKATVGRGRCRLALVGGAK